MDQKYRDYIQDKYSTRDLAYGKCAEATLNMQKIFPKLVRVRGHVDCSIRGMKEHWWLKDEDTIIDPTALQFMIMSSSQYKEWDETAPEPTGKCGNCGDYCYNGDYTCSDRCENIMRDYMNNI